MCKWWIKSLIAGAHTIWPALLTSLTFPIKRATYPTYRHSYPVPAHFDYHRIFCSSQPRQARRPSCTIHPDPTTIKATFVQPIQDYHPHRELKSWLDFSGVEAGSCCESSTCNVVDDTWRCSFSTCYHRRTTSSCCTPNTTRCVRVGYS